MMSNNTKFLLISLWLAIFSLSCSSRVDSLYSASLLKSADFSEKLPNNVEMDVRAMSFSRDGRLLAAGWLDNVVMIWDVESGQQVKSFLSDRTAGKPLWTEACGSTVVFSSDGRKLLTGSTVVNRGDILRGDPLRIQSVAFPNQAAHLWDLNSGREIATYPCGHYIYSAEFSADGDEIVTAGTDGYLGVWNVKTNSSSRLLPGYGASDDVLSARFSPDGRYIASGGVGAFILFDAASGTEVWRIMTDRRFRDVAFSPDGQYVAAMDVGAGAYVWRLADRRLMFKTPFVLETPTHLAFSVDGSLLLVSGSNGEGATAVDRASHPLGLVRIVDWKTGIESREIESPGSTLTGLSVSPDGRHLAIGDKNGIQLRHYPSLSEHP